MQGWQIGEMCVITPKSNVGKSMLIRQQWCWNKFGPAAQDTWYYDGDGNFIFAQEADRILFLLRWA